MRWLRRLGRTITGRTGDLGVSDELRQHVEMETQDLIARGVAPDEARRQALIALGGADRFCEEARDARGVRWLDDLRRDIGYTIRSLRRAPGFTFIVVLTLALGIGANTALFTAVNGLLLQSVAVPAPDELVRLKWAGQNDMVGNSSDYGFSEPDQGRNVRATVSFEVFRNLRAANQTMVDLAASAPIGQFNVVIDGDAQFASSLAVSGNYFRMLQLTPAIGRLLTEDDDDAARAPVAVISHAYWRSRFAEDPTVGGRVVSINRRR